MVVVTVAGLAVVALVGLGVWAWWARRDDFDPRDLPEYSDATARVGHACPTCGSPVPSITCPDCGMTSYNGNDIAAGYCGNCHAWTSKD
jgi:uncharacterized iron-regulated membrane protein